MGSVEGFSGGGVVVRDVGRDTEGACGSGARKEKTQIVKQKSSSNCRRGDKRNTKAQKNRCDSFSLKNGLVGFNSAAGGHNFFGLYGLKTDVFDITQYVNEMSLDDLLHGSDNCPSIAKDKGKKAAKSNSNLLESVGKACYVLQANKVLETQRGAETDNNCILKTSGSLGNPSSVSAPINKDKVDSCTTDLPCPDKVQESVDDSPLYKLKDILERLALPPAKDLDLLLSEATKTSSSLKNCTDRSGKAVTHRTGLSPFPWSHSFSGHNKLNPDAVKLSTSRTTCQGRWVKVKNAAVLQKGSADFLLDFDSLDFDRSLVPEVKHIQEHTANATDPLQRVLSSSRSCSMKNIPADEPSPTYTAAQTLCDLAILTSKEKPRPSLNLQKQPPQMSIKPRKSEKSDKLFRAPKSIKESGDGFPSKKLKLSTDVPNIYINHATDSLKKGPSRFSSLHHSFKSPPRKKVCRDSFTGTDSYSMNFVKTSYMMKPPRGADRPSSSEQSLKKVLPMKWSRPES